MRFDVDCDDDDDDDDGDDDSANTLTSTLLDIPHTIIYLFVQSMKPDSVKSNWNRLELDVEIILSYKVWPCWNALIHLIQSALSLDQSVTVGLVWLCWLGFDFIWFFPTCYIDLFNNDNERNENEKCHGLLSTSLKLTKQKKMTFSLVTLADDQPDQQLPLQPTNNVERHHFMVYINIYI